VLKKRQLDPVCSGILRAYKLFDAILRQLGAATMAAVASPRRSSRLPKGRNLPLTNLIRWLGLNG